MPPKKKKEETKVGAHVNDFRPTTPIDDDTSQKKIIPFPFKGKGIIECSYTIHLNIGKYSHVELTSKYSEDASTQYDNLNDLSKRIEYVLLASRRAIKRVLEKDDFDFGNDPSKEEIDIDIS